MLQFPDFQLLILVAVGRRHSFQARHGRKPQICFWNINYICHVSRDINISAFGNHIAISGYRLLSKSLGNTFIELAVVENVGFAAEILTVSAIIPEI